VFSIEEATGQDTFPNQLNFSGEFTGSSEFVRWHVIHVLLSGVDSSAFLLMAK